MLRWALIFLVIALVAGDVLGLLSVASGSLAAGPLPRNRRRLSPRCDRPLRFRLHLDPWRAEGETQPESQQPEPMQPGRRARRGR